MVSKNNIIELDTTKTRRAFVKAFAASGGGLAGLQFAGKKAFGSTPDGVPIVWRRDRFGNPVTVRYISKERRKKINMFYNIGDYFGKKSDYVNGITLNQESDNPDELFLKVYVDKSTPSVRRDIPNRLEDIPIAIEERKTNPEPQCDLKQYFYDPLPANPQIYGYDSGERTKTGSLGVVCWNDDENDPYECYITASHVINSSGTPDDYIQHRGNYNGEAREELVGEYADHSPLAQGELDVAKYRRRAGTADADPLENASDQLTMISGSWTFQGLTDATTGSNTVGADFAGQTSCYIDTDCYDTEIDAAVYYQANYSTDETGSGDSGGTYLDKDGYLLGTHYGNWNGGSAGPTAEELLDRLNAVLYDPSEINP